MHAQTAIAGQFRVFIAADFCENIEPTFPRQGTPALTSNRGASSIMADEQVTRRVWVYKITCTVNGKLYFGITARSVPQRAREHFSQARSKDAYRTALHREIRLLGADKFIVEEVCAAFGIENACAIEREMIADYGAEFPHGYNLSNGGEGSVGRMVAQVVRETISEKVRALWADPDYRTRMEAAFQTRAPAPPSHIEHLRRLASAQKGKPRNPEAVAKGRASLMGHAVSEETRAKIGAKSKGRPWSDEARAAAAERMREQHASGSRKHTTNFGRVGG